MSLTVYKYQDTISDPITGRPASGATVTVKNHSDGSLATLYDETGSSTIPNPVTTDSLGLFSFSAPVGTYDLNCQVGSNSASRTGVFIDGYVDLESGVIGFTTKALLDADLAHPDKAIAWVTNDPTSANNGTYTKSGAAGTGSWVQASYDRVAEVEKRTTTVETSTAGVSANSAAILKDLLGVLSDLIVWAVGDQNGNAPLALTTAGKTIAKALRILGTLDVAGATTVADLVVNGTIRSKLSFGASGGELSGQDWLDSAGNAVAAAVLDAYGNSPLSISKTGAVIIQALQLAGIKNNSFTLGSHVTVDGGDYDFDFAVTDANGNVAIGTKNGQFYSPGAVSSGAKNDARNLAIASLTSREIQAVFQKTTAPYNHIIVYGQSLSSGYEGWPALSKTAKFGNLMLGNCVRPAAEGTNVYTPIGSATLQPLIEVVNQGSTILTDSQVAALTPGDGSKGETVCSGMVNFAKYLHNRQLLTENDTTRNFVVTCDGTGGRTIEQLSKGASPELYQTVISAVNQVQTIANGQGKAQVVPAIIWMQGEYNYTTAYGGDATKDGYKSKLATLYQNFVTDLMVITGQAAPPAMITYQTGASYTSDTNNLAIGMAQWEFTKENQNCFMAGPVYPYTDKGGHMDSNGYRWFGNMLGKVFHRVVTLGQGWRPLSPIRTSRVGRVIDIDFHVPYAPLVFDTPYVINTATDYTTKGFKVTDDSGTVPISSVSIIGSSVVEIVVGRDIVGSSYVWYASQATNGNGCLRDSDPTVALDKYEYNAGSGQYASVNVAALVGKPYPLFNWCVAFYLPTTWGAL